MKENILETCSRIAKAGIEGMKTRARRRQMEREAKKAGVPVAVIEYGEMVKENEAKAQEVSLEFNKALAALGYRLMATISTNHNDGSRVPKIVLTDLSYREHQQFLKDMEAEKESTDKELVEEMCEECHEKRGEELDKELNNEEPSFTQKPINEETPQ